MGVSVGVGRVHGDRRLPRGAMSENHQRNQVCRSNPITMASGVVTVDGTGDSVGPVAPSTSNWCAHERTWDSSRPLYKSD
eukprot:9503432-Pyramimonas_sp.AAC.2